MVSAQPVLFFSNVPAATAIYTLSLHDAFRSAVRYPSPENKSACRTDACKIKSAGLALPPETEDRKSTRLNSSHVSISYAVFCLKKKTVGCPAIGGLHRGTQSTVLPSICWLRP